MQFLMYIKMINNIMKLFFWIYSNFTESNFEIFILFSEKFSSITPSRNGYFFDYDFFEKHFEKDYLKQKYMKN
jgi:hypothetical protein